MSSKEEEMVISMRWIRTSAWTNRAMVLLLTSI